MRTSTTIAAILLEDGAEVAIDLLADAVLGSSIAKRASSKSVTWDCEDLVFLDFAPLRIALHDIAGRDDAPSCVCIAVGAMPGMSLPRFLNSAYIAKGLVAQLSQTLTASAILWHEDDRALCAEVMDDFNEESEKMLDHLHAQLAQVQSQIFQEQAEVHSDPAAQPRPAREQTRMSTFQDDTALEALRQQLRSKGALGEAISIPLHVSIYIMACTLLLVLPAIGSAVLSYVALRDGVDRTSNEA